MMGLCCCCFHRKDDSLQGLQHGLTENDESLDNNVQHENETISIIENDQHSDVIDLNTLRVTGSQTASHPIHDVDDLKIDHNHTCHRMHRRKNLKSYLTEIRRSKQQCISKKKKLKQLLLDKSNDIEYNTAFDLNKSPNAPKFQKLSSRTVFPERAFTEWIVEKGIILNNIINDIYNDCIGYIPEEISRICWCYTLDLLPGIYEFVGTKDYNGTDDESDVINNRFGGGNHCQCQIILNTRCEIIGGHFSENTFKYHITNGTYTYEEPYGIEFTKEYFNYNCKYKVYGQIIRNSDGNIEFKGHWKLLEGNRGGNVMMNYVKTKPNHKLNAGCYEFYGYCNYLPNTSKRHLFDDTQMIKCCLNLNRKDFKVQGVIKFILKDIGHSESDDDIIIKYDNKDEDNVFVIDEMESEWDIYGGLHIVLVNGYLMEGFFDGEEFMGVWKDQDFARFGHFQYGLCNAHEDSIAQITQLTKAESLDSDDDAVSHEEHDMERKF